MSINDTFTPPTTTDGQAICDRLDAIHADLRELIAQQGTQGLGWDGGQTTAAPDGTGGTPV
ncbi:hypothetical protein [Microbacterium sp. CIAB417]|uniref:hypothetical protein n=1 Tax=Microbacterium sp. CIAB417 TaxID=2860287 RepID=UPI001FAC8D1C|nr:hypothetical protein [Microbacterium sp. CIAB417]